MSKRHIILLRHAEAVGTGNGLSDQARPLTPHGETEAEAAGAWLKAHAAPIQRVLYSPALRAKQTAEDALHALGAVEQREDARIYEATPGALMDVLADNADVEWLLLVGHNPGLESLVALLSTGQSGDHRGMATAGVAWLELPAESAIEPGVATLKHFWSP